MTSLISYAQNFEDVMLWRALKHVKKGFYLDIGAQDPLVDSVSLAFHERGWKGIHVEPTPHYAQLLREQRQGDTVLEVAVGNAGELLTFFEIPDTGISTADPQIAQQHRERGFETREITVPCVRLSSIFKTCGKRVIHWMKVDVEGFELSALSSWGKATARPWIVVVESTLPMTQIESHLRWEPLLLRRGYVPVYFDGLNRYYVSKEKAELKQAFSTPPNVFDDFSVNGTASTAIHHHLSARHAAELGEVFEQVKRANNEIEDIKRSHVERELRFEEQLRGRSTELDTRKAEMLHVEDALRAEIQALKSTTVQLSGALVTAKDEYASSIQAAYEETLKSTTALAAREREFAGQASAQAQVYRAELSLFQAEVARTNGLVIAAKDEFAGVLQSAQADALRATQALTSREREFAAQLAAQHHASLIATSSLHAEVARTNGLLVAAKEELVVALHLAQEETRQATEALTAREREFLRQHAAVEQTYLTARQEMLRTHEAALSDLNAALRDRDSDAVAALIKLTAEKETVKRLEAECQRLEQIRTDHLATQQKQDAMIAQLNLESRQLREHLVEAKKDLAAEAHQLRNRDAQIMQLKERFVVEVTTLQVALHTSAKRMQRWVLGTRKLKSRQGLHDRFALIAPLLEIQANVRKSINPSIEKAGDMEQQKFLRANFQPDFEISASDVYHIDDFLVLHDKAFVDACYTALLKRVADPVGMEFYVERVRVGISKAQILEEISMSTEGRATGVRVEGLKEAIRRRWWCELPLIGKVVVAFSFVANLSSYLQDLRALENHLVRSAEQIQSVSEVNLNSLIKKITAK